MITPLLGSPKAIIIMGARQVGKSTLLTQMLGNRNDVMWMSGDDTDIQALFSQMTSTRIRTILANCRILVIDEAQRISDIGLRLKLITDQVPGVQVIATGSSSFELANKIYGCCPIVWSMAIIQKSSARQAMSGRCSKNLQTVIFIATSFLSTAST